MIIKTLHVLQLLFLRLREMYDDFSDVNYSTEFMTEDVKFKLADVKKPVDLCFLEFKLNQCSCSRENRLFRLTSLSDHTFFFFVSCYSCSWLLFLILIKFFIC